jgi:hypothetical protein
MTFKAIQDAVIDKAFNESDRANVKNWIVFRHAWLWDLCEWQFKFGTATVTFTANSQIVGSLPTDFLTAITLYDTNGIPVAPVRDFRTFFDTFNANLQNGSGSPEAFTVLDSQMFVGPAGDGTTGLLVYEKSKPALVNDTDTTGLPDGYDLALVHGGKAEGFKLANVPLWQGFDEDFTAAANAMQRQYLTSIRGQVGQMGAYRPGGYLGQWR